MDNFPVWLFTGLIIGIVPTMIHKKKKKKSSIVVYCPYCHQEIGLDKLRNYICPNCKNTVVYYETYKNIKFNQKLIAYDCKHCGTSNMQNIKFCQNCHKINEQNVKYNSDKCDL